MQLKVYKFPSKVGRMHLVIIVLLVAKEVKI